MIFCEEWDKHESQPIDILTEIEAKSYHSSGKPYVVYFEDPSQRIIYLEIEEDSVFTIFLDLHKRQEFSYQFLMDPIQKKLFLRQAIYWEYTDEGNSWNNRTMYTFKDDLVSIEKFSRITKEKEKSTLNNDNSGNWENYPNFGQYENFIKKER